jgi:hypothetical protein
MSWRLLLQDLVFPKKIIIFGYHLDIMNSLLVCKVSFNWQNFTKKKTEIKKKLILEVSSHQQRFKKKTVKMATVVYLVFIV